MKFKMTIVLFCLLTMIANGPVMGQIPEDNLAAYQAQFDAMNAHDLDTMMSYWADDSVWDIASAPPPAPKMYVEMGLAQRFAARPDFRMTEGRTFAVGDIVVEEALTMYTVVDTGAEVVVPHLSIYEFEGGLIKKVTTYNDKVGPMVQRGEMPAPEPIELTPSITVPDHEPTGLSAMEANAEHIKRWNSHDAALTTKMYHADLNMFVGPLGQAVDRSAMTAINEMYFTGFPDTNLQAVRTIDLGQGWILTEHVGRGTHLNTFMGVPAAGYSMEIRLVWLMRYSADGMVIEGSFYYDNLTFMNQMTTPEWSAVGQWITTVPTPLGNAILEGTWLAQDTAETRLVGEYKEINALPLFTDIYPEVDETFYGGEQAVKVARQTYDITFLVYYTRKPGPNVEEIVGLGVVSGTFKVVGPAGHAGQGSGAYYLASQDADQDGFPDEGEEPVACFPWTWTSKRVPMIPGCIPPPMPGQ